MKIKQRIYRLFVNLKQRTSRLFRLIIVCLAALFGLNPSVNADIFRVATNGSCTGDGTTWPNAFKYLQDALDEAAGSAGPHQIWVRAGTYYVDQSCANEVGTRDRAETFQLVEDVFLLGGFDGTELFASERDSVANITILSGIVDHGEQVGVCGEPGNGSCFEPHAGPGCENSSCCQLVCDSDPLCCLEGENWSQACVTLALELCGEAYHVVTAGSEIDDPEQTVIDGFTIRDGWANGDSLDENHGGGMFIEGEPSVVRCTFTSNTASTRGGGMSITGDFKQPWIINCTFEDNPGDQALIPINGGGLASNQADPILTNCLFVGNFAEQNGGGLYNLVGSCPPGDGCGRITLINCTVAFNTAGTNFTGGGLFFDGGPTGGRLDADNTIVWGNNPGNNQIDGVGQTVFDINYSDCEGVCPPGIGGTGNKNVVPEFVFAPVNLRLLGTSPVIDMGNPLESVIPCDFFNLDNDDFDCTFMADEATPDLDLINRVLDGDDDGEAIVDMGAYEFRHPDVCSCPDICPADFDGSCAVDVKDLLFLLGAWGPCPDPPVECPADFDGSGAVDVKDLLFLLGAWGPCPCAAGPPPPSLREAVEDAGLDWPDDWDEFEEVMTNPESSQEEKDNYYCWMNHYLNHCTGMACTTPNCPDDAPFGHHE